MKKGTIIAAAVFAALLVAAVMSTNRKPERGITRVSFATLDKSRIDRLEIAGPNPVELKKGAAGWALANGKQAEQSAVEAALDALTRIDTADLVTSNSARFAELEVDEAKGTRVAAWAGSEKLAELVAGKASSGGLYVRSGDQVFSASGLSPFAFSKPVASWTQLKLFTDKFEDATRVEVALAGKPAYALVKNGEQWALEDPAVGGEGFRFDPDMARVLATALVNARAKEFVDADPGAEKTGLNEGFDTLAFVGKEGARHELRLGKAREDNSVFAKVAGREDLFVLQEFSARGLRKPIDELRSVKPMSFEPAKATRLSIREGKNVLEFERKGADWSIARSSAPVPKDFQLDPSAITRRIASIANARALAVLPPAKLAASGTLSVTLEDGSTATLAFGASTKHQEKEGWAATGNADGHVYLMTPYLHDEAFKGLESFEKRPVPEGGMPQLDANALSQLPPEVRKSLEEQLRRQQQMQQLQQAVQTPPPPPPPPPAR